MLDRVYSTSNAIVRVRVMIPGLKKQPAETVTLLRIARVIATLDLDEVLSRAASMTARAFSAGRVIIYLVSPDRRYVQLAVVSGKRRRRSVWPIEKIGPLTAQVLKTGRILRVRDLRVHPDRRPDTTTALSFVSFVAVPLVFGSHRLGCLQVGEPDRLRTFTAREITLLTGIADLLAVAIRNARLAGESRGRLKSLRRVSSQLWSAQEEERKRISRELHDDAGQSLTALKLDLSMLRNELPDGPFKTRVDGLAASSQALLERLRGLARDLRPRALDELGMAAALSALASGFGARTGIRLSLALDESVRLEGERASAAYRFVQEALTNVARHAEAKRARVTMETVPQGLLIEVADDGRGFDPERATDGLGLLGMRERAGLVGGRVTVDSTPGRGTRIRLLLRRAAEKRERRG